jgi:hypothetical protein
MIGVGTVTPGYAVDVVGDVNVSGAFRVNGTPISGSGISALTGDVIASGSGSVAATVAFVDGSSAANVHAAELLANAASSSNTVSTIVRRDSSGNFAAGNITGNQFTDTTQTVGTISTTLSVNWANGAIVTGLMGANWTSGPSFSGAIAGQTLTLFLQQNGATAYTTLWTGIKWSGGAAPAISSTLGAVDIYSFYYDGTHYYGFIGGQAFA